MNNRASLSDEDVKELTDNACGDYQAGTIGEKAFRSILGGLGFNATDIEELVTFYRPSPAEGDWTDDVETD